MAGHWCWKCRRTCANERFSGAGHRQHRCQDCQRELKRERQMNRGARLRSLTEHERTLVITAVTGLRERRAPRTMSAVVAEIQAVFGVDLLADGYAGFGSALCFFGRAAREGLVVVRSQGRQEVILWLPEEAAAEECLAVTDAADTPDSAGLGDDLESEATDLALDDLPSPWLAGWRLACSSAHRSAEAAAAPLRAGGAGAWRSRERAVPYDKEPAHDHQVRQSFRRSC